jgi:hypothetical protein
VDPGHDNHSTFPPSSVSCHICLVSVTDQPSGVWRSEATPRLLSILHPPLMSLSPEDFLRTRFASIPPVEAQTVLFNTQDEAPHVEIDVIWSAQWAPEPVEDGLRCIRYHDVSFCTEGSSEGRDS